MAPIGKISGLIPNLTSIKPKEIKEQQQGAQPSEVKAPQFLGYTVPQVSPVRGPERTGEVGQPRRVSDVDNSSVAYTDNRGYVGLAFETTNPLANGQLGYQEKMGFKPREIAVA